MDLHLKEDSLMGVEWGGALRAIRDKVDSENQKNIVSSAALIS